MAIGQAEQDPNLPHLASNVLSSLYLTVAGQVEVPVGLVNLSGSLPHSANKFLEPLLHPDIVTKNLTCSDVIDMKFYRFD